MIEIIQQRLNTYPEHLQESALKEIIQEVALFGLWRAGFFKIAAFQGGTSLRILHKLPRFSEDLDFILLEPSSEFQWRPYLGKLIQTLNQFGIEAEVTGPERLDKQIRRAAIKDNSLVNQLDLSFFRGAPGRKLQVKLEIDVNPPGGSNFGFTFLDYPSDFEVRHGDLASNFSLKLHALLCRPWVKGRDWFDFSWYVRKQVAPNFDHLKSALFQAGPWYNEPINVDAQWLRVALAMKIRSIDWSKAITDVERFLDNTEREGLSLWSSRFFESRLDVLMKYIAHQQS